jgi:hypothetical protein
MRASTPAERAWYNPPAVRERVRRGDVKDQSDDQNDTRDPEQLRAGTVQKMAV